MSAQSMQWVRTSPVSRQLQQNVIALASRVSKKMRSKTTNQMLAESRRDVSRWTRSYFWGFSLFFIFHSFSFFIVFLFHRFFFFIAYYWLLGLTESSWIPLPGLTGLVRTHCMDCADMSWPDISLPYLVTHSQQHNSSSIRSNNNHQNHQITHNNKRRLRRRNNKRGALRAPLLLFLLLCLIWWFWLWCLSYCTILYCWL